MYKEKIDIDPNKVIKVEPKMVKDNFKIMCNEKRVEVILSSIDPLGSILKSKKLSMKVIDDSECMKSERLLLHVGDYLYRIDKHGKIIEQLVPHENN